jgi:hypothetical protein
MQRYYSNVYWHFVGSPPGVDWRKVRKPADIIAQGGTPKNLATCMNIVLEILKTGTLRATCIERISPTITTRPFCCVTDIPVKDLPSHSPYYGRVAVGFRSVAIHASFLPVLYYPTVHLPQVHTGYEGIPVKRWLPDVDKIAPIMEPDPALASNPFKDCLKLTDFSVHPDESFYREREWRHAGSDFRFAETDVAAIVAPEEALSQLRRWLQQQSYCDDRISLIAWELIEDA